MSTATIELLDRVSAANGGCTDYRISKLIGVTTSAVSNWRSGKHHASTAQIERLVELTGDPASLWEWNLRIGAERERGPDGAIYRAALQDLQRVRDGGEPAADGLFALLARVTGRAAAVTVAALLFAGALGSSGTYAAARDVRTVDDLYIMRTRRRRWPLLKLPPRGPLPDARLLHEMQGCTNAARVPYGDARGPGRSLATHRTPMARTRCHARRHSEGRGTAAGRVVRPFPATLERLAVAR